jgi:signal transduction histidine kinase
MTKRRRNYSIGVRGKLVLSLLLLVVLSMWLLGLALMGLTKSSLRAQMSARAGVIAAAVENAIEVGGFRMASPGESGLSDRLEKLLASFTEDPDVEEVTVFDRDGAVAGGGAGSAGSEQAALLEFSFPVSLGPGETGRIDVVFSRGSMRRQLGFSLVRIIVQLFITALVIVVFINILASLTVLAPIRKLLLATERIGSGDLTRGVDAGGRDEIGDLAHSFNIMLEQLRGSEERIREQLDSLRKAHADLQAKEEALVESEKMAAVGRVAAGVAHEVGNPLGSVTGYLAMLRDENLSDEESRDCLDRTGKELERISRIMTDLLNYARQPRLEWSDIDVNMLVRGARSLLAAQPEFKTSSFRTELAEGLPPVRGDLHLAQQMLVNFILNASQAMPGGGLITLKTFSEDESGPVVVTVADEGPGIQPEDLPHLFEPFFSSGKAGRGSGLGLALCKRIAASMSASIEVDSNPGEGATFKVVFPAGEGNGRKSTSDG